MKGKILNIDGDQIIASAEDGERYEFTQSQWRSTNSKPKEGMEIDFKRNEGKAEDVFEDKSLSSTRKTEDVFLEVPMSNAGLAQITTVLFAAIFGIFGFHKFYMRCNIAGGATMAVTLSGIFLMGIPTAVVFIVSIIEAVIYLSKSQEEFHKTYLEHRKCWF